MRDSQIETRWFTVGLYLHVAILSFAMACIGFWLASDFRGEFHWLQIMLGVGSVLILKIPYHAVLAAADLCGLWWGRPVQIVKPEPCFHLAIIFFVFSFCPLIPLARNPQFFGIGHWILGIGMVVFIWSFSICLWFWSLACRRGLGQKQNVPTDSEEPPPGTF